MFWIQNIFNFGHSTSEVVPLVSFECSVHLLCYLCLLTEIRLQQLLLGYVFIRVIMDICIGRQGLSTYEPLRINEVQFFYEWITYSRNSFFYIMNDDLQIGLQYKLVKHISMQYNNRNLFSARMSTKFACIKSVFRNLT